MSAGFKRISQRCLRVAAVAAGLGVLAGCQGLGSLSGSASMLVEVDVYKGPLNNSKTVQLGELVAVFDEAEPLLAAFVRDVRGGRRTCVSSADPGSGLLCDAASRAEAIRWQMHAFPQSGDTHPAPDRPAYDDSDAEATVRAAERNRAFKELNDAAAAVMEGKDGAESLAKKRALLHAAVLQATRIATQLKVEAFYAAEAQIGSMALDRRIRSSLVDYVNLASELSNQIASRTDVLAKQLERRLNGADLALSDHLKDAGPTDFLNLYDWYDATMEDDPLNSGPRPRLDPQDRVRLARRLFSDHYWTRINQVHASGQGDVRMALIKDDIGNWNLKSFDNDPERLLDAYRRLTLAGIEAGVRVARTIGSGDGAARLDLASQFARGRLGATDTAAASARRIDAMRTRAQADLESLQLDLKQRDPALAAAETAAQAAADQRTRQSTDRTGAYRQAQERNAAQQKRVDQARLNDRPLAEQEALDKELTVTAEQEELRRQELAQAQTDEAAARTVLEMAQAKRRSYLSNLFAEAKKSVEVHRRVIDSLKELQGGTPAVR